MLKKDFWSPKHPFFGFCSTKSQQVTKHEKTSSLLDGVGGGVFQHPVRGLMEA
jgi:hypothetical protein